MRYSLNLNHGWMVQSAVPSRDARKSKLHAQSIGSPTQKTHGYDIHALTIGYFSNCLSAVEG